MTAAPLRTVGVASEEDSSRIELPGRQWGLLLGPANVGAANMTLGFSIFPAGSAPSGHTHPAEEEMIYVLSGRGQIITDAVVVDLRPGLAVYIPPGLHHATAADDDEPLHLLTAFSPPVIPGSYEPPASND
ncbi:MAG: cupin domain-containing protein [Candidatus Dormiibacterota bacterium]